MHFRFQNVEAAFNFMVELVANNGTCYTDDQPVRLSLIKMHSRNGSVIVFPEPMTITYTNPRQRVLLNPARDANPFFHLFESVWMLAGCREVRPLTKFVERMQDYSDDGNVMHGAYGYRWRKWFGTDQLKLIITELKTNPESRRCVLQMWDSHSQLPESPGSLLGGDLMVAIKGGRDVPCNIAVTFMILDGKLNMSVFNRSNDMIWGMLGANAVHMSYLLEYVAAMVGVPVGVYNQITTNLHIYESFWKPEEWLNSNNIVCAYDHQLYPVFNFTPQHGHFDREATKFVEDYRQKCWNDPWLEQVVKPMCMAHDAYKRHNFPLALDTIELVADHAWRCAGKAWINRRIKRALDKAKSKETKSSEAS